MYQSLSLYCSVTIDVLVNRFLTYKVQIQLYSVVQRLEEYNLFTKHIDWCWTLLEALLGVGLRYLIIHNG